MSEEQAEVVPEVKVDEDALRAALDAYDEQRAHAAHLDKALVESRRSLVEKEARAAELLKSPGIGPVLHNGKVYRVQGGKLKRQELTNLDG